MQDSPRRNSNLVGSSFVESDVELLDLDSVLAWTMHEDDLDDLESSLRYLERQDRGAWEHVNLLLSELREEAEPSDAA